MTSRIVSLILLITCSMALIRQKGLYEKGECSASIRDSYMFMWILSILNYILV